MDKKMKSYELFLIFSTHIGEDERNAISQKFCAIINTDGQIEKEDHWGKKRLANLIKKETDGFYTVISFQAGSSIPTELGRVARITDGLLRSLVLSCGK